MIVAVLGLVGLLCWRQFASTSAHGVHRIRRLLESIEPPAGDGGETGP
jgi:hypothetical protein